MPFVLFPWRQLCLLNSSICYVITPNRNFRTPAKTFYKCFEYPNVCSDWSSNTHKFHLFEQRAYIKINKFVQGFESFTQNKSESVRRFENTECFPLDLLSSNIRFVKKKKSFVIKVNSAFETNEIKLTEPPKPIHIQNKEKCIKFYLQLFRIYIPQPSLSRSHLKFYTKYKRTLLFQLVYI